MTRLPLPPGAALADLWLTPHRPLFLAAALWALVSIGWWQWGAALGLAPPSLGTPGYWHAHEMLLGFGGASIAAYFLTALSSWTGRAAPSGAALKIMVAFWLLQRLAMVWAETLPPLLLILPGLAYFGLVGGILARGIARARVWHKLGFPLAVAALGIGDALFLLSARTAWSVPDAAMLLRGLVMFFAIKISIVAGKMLPAFTGNWLQLSGAPVPPPRDSLLANRLSLVVLFLALALTLLGAERASAIALVLAGPLQIWRMAHWRGRHTTGNALLVMMHGAFVWLALGLMLTGLARLLPGLLREADLAHALLMGAMAGMVLAVAARAAARREGGTLRAGPQLIGACALLWLAASLRLGVALWPGVREALVAGSAILWCGGWALFLAAFVPTIFGPVLRPIFSGAKA